MAHVDPPEGSTFALQGFLGSSTGANRSGGPRSSVGHPTGLDHHGLGICRLPELGGSARKSLDWFWIELGDQSFRSEVAKRTSSRASSTGADRLTEDR